MAKNRKKKSNYQQTNR